MKDLPAESHSPDAARVPLRILHLEDDVSDAELLEMLLRAEKLDSAITCSSTRDEFQAALDTGSYDLIISDYSLPGFDGLSALKLAREQLPEIPFIFVSGTIGEERAVEALLHGATDYVIKDRPARLAPAIRRALAEAEARRRRKQAESRIREQAELLDRAQDAICLLDLDQTILYWNQSAGRLYGWNAAEAAGRNVNEMLVPSDPAGPAAALKSLLRHGGWQGELHQTARDGRKLIVESRWNLVRGSDDEPRSILVINTDVTEKRQIETQLLRTQRLDSIGALAGGIAHDLNNCLTPVILGINVVQQEVASETGRKMLSVMEASARRAVDMVKQILSYARGVGGEPAVLPLPRLINDMIRLVEDTFPRSIKIEGQIAPDLRPVTGNATQLNQVLLNLCVNARDAMPEGGRLRLTAANLDLSESDARLKQLRPGPYVLLTVSDTGQGMTPEVLGRIFEPFFTTKDQGRGTGLGLSTLLGIVKSHGGLVEVASEPGRGSVFSVYLPSTELPALPSSEHQPAMVEKGHGELVLVVDDEPAVLEMTRLLLESAGYNTLTAPNGQEALAIYRRYRSAIGLVLTDMMMPVMSGPEAIVQLHRINSAVKIVGMSGLAAEESPLVNAAQPLIQAFLRKPFTTTDLLDALHRLLPVTTSAGK